MQALALRLRIFLFFCLIAGGGTFLMICGLILGFRQLGEPTALSAFVTAGVVGGLGLTGLVLGVWLLFDENVAKPIEALAAGARLRAHTGVDEQIHEKPARYLGDLAPAVAAMQKRLAEISVAPEAALAQRVARLETQRAQLLQILSDLPVAVIVAKHDHQIILYDGQAAELMERECPARLGGSVFDYLEEGSVVQALERLRERQGRRLEIAVTGHSGDIYKGHLRRFGDGEGYSLMLETLAPDAARPLVYDFDLLDRNVDAARALDDCSLRDLSFVVFDSETTGLDPEKDAVVQLGAVRIVNGKIVPGEVFDALVNPGRPIPPASSRVHGITDEMVLDAPDFDSVCASFHQFSAGSVIVAHNAPFDMSFLRRAATSRAYFFDNPVLDTVHLSAVTFGGSAEHTLDALCRRLQIDIPENERHTALGDAMATAEALVALIPVLEARGLNTFGALRKEVRKHSRLLTADA